MNNVKQFPKNKPLWQLTDSQLTDQLIAAVEQKRQLKKRIKKLQKELSFRLSMFDDNN